MKTLIYTIAMDTPGKAYYSSMARLLALSIRASGSEHDILIFSNAETGLFAGRHGIEEIFIDTGALSAEEISRLAKTMKFTSRHQIDAQKYEKILYLDCDCLVISDIDLLLHSSHPIVASVETWGKITNDAFRAYLSDQEMDDLTCMPINSGIFQVVAPRFFEVMETWENIYNSPRVRGSGCEDQPSWVRLVLDAGEDVEFWEFNKLIRYPLVESVHVNARKTAAVFHYLGMSGQERLDYMIADYCRMYQKNFTQLMCEILRSV